MDSRFRQRTRSAASSSASLQLTPLACRSSQNVDRQVFLGLPLISLPSTGIQSIALWAGRGAIRRTCPANRNLLSPTMSCSRLCPVRFSTSVFVTLSLKVTPMIFPKFRWWNTSSFCCIFSCFYVSLAYMAVDMTTAVYSCNLILLILSPGELDFHMLSSLLKTVTCCFASRLCTSFQRLCTSIWRYQDMWSDLHILALPVLCRLAGNLTYCWSW